MKLNPEKISWQHDGKNDDGSAFNPELFDGWELYIDSAPTMSVPIGWRTDGKYTAPVFGTLTLPNGQHSVAIRLLSKNGQHSPISAPDTFLIDARTPSVPFAFAVGGGLEV